MKYTKTTPIFTIGYLKDIHEYYKQENVVREDWKNCDVMYKELLHAYHCYVGLKKDYRKDRKPKKVKSPTNE